MERKSGEKRDRRGLVRIVGPQLAEKLMDMGNLAFGGLVLGQVLADRGFNWWFALLGMGVWFLLFGLAGLLLHWNSEEQ